MRKFPWNKNPMTAETMVVGFFALFVLGVLYLFSRYNYLLFHSVAEVFSVVIACGIFMVVWNTRRHVSNDYLLLIGIAYLFVGILDFVHTLSYAGMNIFIGYDANVPTQLWIAARYMQSLTLMVSPFLMHRRTPSGWLFAVFGTVTCIIFLSIFVWRIFPDCYLPDAGGLTTFKKLSEYIICLILLTAAVLVLRRRRHFGPDFSIWLLMSIAVTVLSELAFTTYADVFGFSNLLGHYLKILSFYFMYKAVIETGLARPHDLLFRNLQRERESLRKSEQRWAVTLASIGDAVIATDTAGRVTFLNPMAERLSGWHLDEAAGRPVKEVFRIVSEHTRTPMDDPVDKVIQTGMTMGLTPHAVLLRKDGGEVPVDVSAAPIRDEEGHVLGVVLVFRDITRRRQAEEALRQLNEMLEQRVAERTELARARSNQLQSLAVQLIEAEERERRRIAQMLHDDLQQVLASAKMQLQAACVTLPSHPLLANVDDLLKDSIAKSRRLSHELSPAVLHHSGLAAGLQWLCGQMDEQFGLKVELETHAPGQFAHTPLKVFIFRAVQELLFNIVKHAGVKQARLVLSGSDSGLEISVCDQGRGFDSDCLQNAAEQTGFGLLSIRERAASLGGSLVIDSAPGRGCRFTIRIPFETAGIAGPSVIDPPAEKAAPISIGSSLHTSITRVLFVDDHKVMRQGLIGLISGQPGIEVVGEAANGLQAVEFARQLIPDVIVMDVSMPLMDGVEATRRIKAEFPRIRIIGLSMMEDEQIVCALREAGAQNFLSKTVSSAELLKEIYGSGDFLQKNSAPCRENSERDPASSLL